MKQKQYNILQTDKNKYQILYLFRGIIIFMLVMAIISLFFGSKVYFFLVTLGLNLLVILIYFINNHMFAKTAVVEKVFNSYKNLIEETYNQEELIIKDVTDKKYYLYLLFTLFITLKDLIIKNKTNKKNVRKFCIYNKENVLIAIVNYYPTFNSWNIIELN